MGPIGIASGVLVVVFGLIGLVRGFLKELGVTTVLLIVLFVFRQWGEEAIAPAVVGLVSTAASTLAVQAPDEKVTSAAFYIIVTMIATFVSYHGETLTFRGKSPRGLVGLSLALLVGLVNGYLVAGTMWYYLQEFDYPFGLFASDPTLLEEGIAQILPMVILSPFLPFLAVFMIILRVIR
jgi:hypothetical protein